MARVEKEYHNGRRCSERRGTQLQRTEYYIEKNLCLKDTLLLDSPKKIFASGIPFTHSSINTAIFGIHV